MSQLQTGGDYSLRLWHTTANQGQFGGDKAAAASLAFVKTLQAELPVEDRLFLPSSPKENDSSVHIALFLPTSKATPEYLKTVTDRLNKKGAVDPFPGHTQFVLSPDVRKSQFSADEISNVREASKSFPGANAPAGAKDQVAVSRGWLERLKKAEGDNIETEIKALLDSTHVADGDHSAWQSVMLAARGIVVVAGGGLATAIGVLYTAYTAIVWMSSVSITIAATGWVTLATPLAILGGVFLAIAIAIKDAKNVLVVVNNVTDDLSFKSDHIIHGNRTSITSAMWPKGVNSGYVPAGFYVYEKKTAALYGSLFGATFSLSGGREFSLGMDCPLTVAGGTNSIRLVGSDDAKKAAELASDSGNAKDDIQLDSGKKVHAKRAASLGSTNWGVCIVDSV